MAELSPLALWWMMRGEARAHPLRILVGATAIAVGVALGFAVHIVNQSALEEFGRAVRSVNGAADLQVHALLPAGFPETLYPRLARRPDVAAVSPVVELAAASGGQGFTLLGLDALRAAAVTPSLLPQPAPDLRRRDPLLDPDLIYYSANLLAASGARIGDRVSVSAAGRQADFLLAGGLPGVGDAQALAVIDIAAAQDRFGQLGRLQRLDLRLPPGSDLAALTRALGPDLPQGTELKSADADLRRGDALSRAYRVNLEMLAMVALLTGGFLVYSAQSLSVARRQSQFALLRVLGLSRQAVLVQVLGEGLLVGALGALAGILLGAGLASLALRLLGADLGGGYFAGVTPSLQISWTAALLMAAAGLLAALAGSLTPALAAGRVAAVVALKNAGPGQDPRLRPRPGGAVLLLLLGGLAALAPAWRGLPLAGYLAIGLILGGGVALMPWLGRAVLTPLRRIDVGSPVLSLAVARLWGAPMQAAVALAAIVASTSLTIAMAVMVTSFRGSVDDWLTQLLSADLYWRVAAPESIDTALQQRLLRLPGVKTIEFRKTAKLSFDPAEPAVALLARPLDRDHPGASLPLLGAARAVPAGERAVWISEPMVTLYGLRAGDHLRLALSPAPLFIAGVWRDYSRQFGALLMDDADYVALTGDRERSEASLTLMPGADPAAVSAALRAALPEAVARASEIGAPQAIRRAALLIFDRSFAVTYALEAIAILVGLTGVAATLSAQTLARAKEFGMLRHIGVTRRQIMLILAAEGALLGATGMVAGLGLGIGMSQVLIHVVNPQSFHWTMQTRLPFSLFAGLAAALIAAAAATALLAGRAALSADAIRAVREDW